MQDLFLRQTLLDHSYNDISWFLGILLIGFLFQRFLAQKTAVLIYRLIRKYASGVDQARFCDLLFKPISFFFSLIIIYLAFSQLHWPPKWNLGDENKFGIKLVTWKIYQFILVYSITKIAIRLIDFFGIVLLTRAGKTESRTDDQLVPFVKEAIKLIVIIFSIFFLLGVVFELNVASLIAGLGIGGIAIALAAKDSLENLLGSFTIFLDKPFSVGDVVKVGNTNGTVEKIGFRSTRIRTFEQTIVTVPNKKMIDAELENISVRHMIRGLFPLALRFDTPPAQLEKFIEGIRTILKEDDLINDNYHVKLDKVTESGITLQIFFFVKTMDNNVYLDVKEKLLFKVLYLAQELDVKFDSKAVEIKVNS